MTDWFSAKILLHFLGVLLLFSIKGLQPLKSAIFILVLTPVVFIPLAVQGLSFVWFGWLADFCFAGCPKSSGFLTHVFYTVRGTHSRTFPASPRLSAAILYQGKFCPPRRSGRSPSQKAHKQILLKAAVFLRPKVYSGATVDNKQQCNKH